MRVSEKMRDGIASLAQFLGRPSTEILASAALAERNHRRTRGARLPRTEIWYELENGIDIVCDDDERVRTIFVRDRDPVLPLVPLGVERDSIHALFGAPDASAAPTDFPGLGPKGGWDRYQLPTFALHFQYSTDTGRVDMVTLMRPDAVP